MKKEEENISGESWQKPAKFFGVVAVVLVLLAVGFFAFMKLAGRGSGLFSSTGSFQKTERKTFEENFEKSRTIEETDKMSNSSSPGWWVNSGALMTTGDGTGKTVQGDLSADSKWYKKYKTSNSRDTDGGLHPQNIFRLVTRSKWQNFSQQVFFKISAVNLSESEYRNGSNGLLLFNRYEDGDNLYYTGIRVDGAAVVKKKYDGKYYTLDEEKIFPGEKYDREKNPNLLPLAEWIGIRSEFRNTPNGDVEIKLFVDKGKTGEWKLAASVTDDGRKEFGKHILSDEGYAGIRTDFMDVEFSEYKIAEL